MKAQYSDLDGKTILVTGATRGIGRGIALGLATQKARIAFNYRGDESRANELKAELIEAGAKDVIPLAFDLTDIEKMQEELKTFHSEHGLIEGLVNNAGISQDKLIMRQKPVDLEKIISVNLMGAMNLTATLSRQFLKTENASIVNISSIVGMMGNPAQTAYSASKAGLLGFTKSLAKELGPKNIRTNAICPGFIDTEMTQALNESLQKSYKESIPLGRFGAPQDVAELTCFLLSQASSYITGEIIKIDGGLYT